MNNDLSIYENGNGGNLAKSKTDLKLANTLFQQVYLSLFGGNLESNTTGQEIFGTKRTDWWGNSIFFRNKPYKQFNSNTERALKENSLSISGRVAVENAIKNDLQGLKQISNVTVQVSILSQQELRIFIDFKQPNEEQNKQIQFIWNNVTEEVITDIEI